MNGTARRRAGPARVRLLPCGYLGDSGAEIAMWAGSAGLAARAKDDTGLQFVLWWDGREKWQGARGIAGEAQTGMTNLLTYEQAAELLDPTGELQITARSIQRHVAAGRLRKVRVGRKPAVLKSDVMELIEPPQEPTMAKESGRPWGDTTAERRRFSSYVMKKVRDDMKNRR